MDRGLAEGQRLDRGLAKSLELIPGRIALQAEIALAARLGRHEDSSAKPMRDTPAQRRDVILVPVSDDDSVLFPQLRTRYRRMVVRRPASADLDAGVEEQSIAAALDPDACASFFSEAAIEHHAHGQPRFGAGRTQPSPIVIPICEPLAISNGSGARR